MTLKQNFIDNMISSGWTCTDPDTLQFGKKDAEDPRAYIVTQVNFETDSSPESVEELKDALIEETFSFDEESLLEAAENHGVDTSEYTNDNDGLLMVVSELEFESSNFCTMPVFN